MINDFTLKSYNAKLKELGYENLEYFSYHTETNNDSGYFFKVDIKGLSFYFFYRIPITASVNVFNVICHHIENILNTYNKDTKHLALDDFKYFIKNQATCKVCFDNKINYSSADYLEVFCFKYSNKYANCKEFMEHLDEIDLVKELGVVSVGEL